MMKISTTKDITPTAAPTQPPISRQLYSVFFCLIFLLLAADLILSVLFNFKFPPVVELDVIGLLILKVGDVTSINVEGKMVDASFGRSVTVVVV